MASILELLPGDGGSVLFSGRVGAVRLPNGQVLLVRSSSSEFVAEAAEPAYNLIPAPDASLPIRRPAYLDAFPLFVQLPASLQALDWQREAPRLWARRREPDGYVRRDPYTGGLIRTAEALREAALAGITPVALSFVFRTGDVDDPEVRYQLRKVVEGVADAAHMFELPVVAGELGSEASVGLHPEVHVFAHGLQRKAAPSRLGPDGSQIVLLGRMAEDLSGSLILDEHGVRQSFPPSIDLVAEARVQELLRGCVSAGFVLSALDCRRGGLLITLAECCATSQRGAEIELPKSWSGLSPAAVLFGEAQSRFVVSLAEHELQRLSELAGALDVPVQHLGRVGGERLIVRGLLDLPLDRLR